MVHFKKNRCFLRKNTAQSEGGEVNSPDFFRTLKIIYFSLHNIYYTKLYLEKDGSKCF